MRMLLRRTGFAATLATGLLLLGAAAHGLTGVDRSLELAVTDRPDRPLLASSHSGGRDCSDARPHDQRI